MVPHIYVWSPTCTTWLIWSPHTLYGIGMLWSPLTLNGIGILGSPLPYMEQLTYGPTTCMYGPPYVTYLHVLHDSYGPP